MAKGDHIKVRRCRGLYSHHGIDMGDGTVIHFAGEPFRNRHAAVCRTDMDAFLAGGKPVVVHHRDGAQPVEDVLAAAMEQLYRADYSLWRNNCEHFATYCRTGRRHSRQVGRVFRAGGLAASAAVLILLSARRRGNSI